jgi:hypothetical protein
MLSDSPSPPGGLHCGGWGTTYLSLLPLTHPFGSPLEDTLGWPGTAGQCGGTSSGAEGEW